MRRSRRGHSGGHEFGGSGEDSFVAVVVTKLTGALLFILLLTMVIMALVPKADEAMAKKSGEAAEKPPALAIRTPESLPEAIAGRPYKVALAADGGWGAKAWGVDGELPEGLAFDPSTGVIQGSPKKGTVKPADLVIRVSDGSGRAASRAQLVVYESSTALTTPSRWKPGLPPVPWRAWMEQGFGFLVLMMVHMVGMNAVSGMERVSTSSTPETARSKRFLAYRMTLRLASLGAAAGLGAWLWKSRLG